jgi:Holliday junction resolvasome RuvABC endonuclease subunit
MSVVLGLDTNSHTTGYSVFKNGKLKSYGTISIPKKYVMPRRLLHFYSKLLLLLDETKPDRS